MILLDTCAWWWALSEPQELSRTASEEIAKTPRDAIYVAGISLWEFSMMVLKGRIELTLSPLDWLKASTDDHGVQVIPITAEISYDSSSLTPFHGDPADRLITATARAHHLVLVTKDNNIRDFSGVRSTW